MTSLEEASALVWPREEPPHTATRATATHSNNSGTLNDLAHSVSSAMRGFMERSKRVRELDDARPSIQAPWVDALLQPDQGYTQVIKRSDFTVNEGGIFPRDHLFRVLLEQGLIHDALVLFKDAPPALDIAAATAASTDPAAPQHRVLGCRVVSVTLMGHGVCGHPGIMHGGMTAALIDETCGYLLYLIRHKGLLNFAAVVTASLEVQYKQPLVPDHPVAVTAWVRETSGRKIWVDVVVADAAHTTPPDGAGDAAGSGNSSSNNNSGSRSDLQGDAAAGGCGRVYATGKALFIVPRPQGSSSALLELRAEGRDTLGQGLLPQRNAAHRYEGNPADV